MNALLARRARKLNDYSEAPTGKCVLYVMARDQRVKDNHALLLAQAKAQELGLPLAVVFCLYAVRAGRSLEQYEFMLAGLRQVEHDLRAYNVPFMLLIGSAATVLPGLFHHVQPAAVYFDFNPLRGPLALHARIAQDVSFAVYEVDAHNVVPAWLASSKQEYSARTLRPKLHALIPDYLTDYGALSKQNIDWPGVVRPMSELEPSIKELLDTLPKSMVNLNFNSGEQAAMEVLRSFIADTLHGYAARRNDPSQPGLSGLSPYLHFGQLWSGTAVRFMLEAADKNPALKTDVDTFIEEAVVRKELSDNYCLHNSQYDSLKGAAAWAQATLAKHAADPRAFVYTYEQFAAARTHDAAWNAAQLELIHTGKMHGYMRMYWAKKVLEWSASPEAAIEYLVRLNDFYSIDGGDPNGYVGILWSVAGLHDRPWGERSVYGTIRCMVYTGLKRKFNIDAYISKYCG